MSLEFKLAFPYEIHVIPTVNGGVIVKCGCAELSFSSTNKLLTAMREYFADPEAGEKAYHEAMKAAGRHPTDATIEPPNHVAQEETATLLALENERTEPG